MSYWSSVMEEESLFEMIRKNKENGLEE